MIKWKHFPNALTIFIGFFFFFSFRFAAINCGIVYLYCLNFQNIDEDEYGGIWELMKEGFMTSFACFSVTWIVFYTGLYFDDVNTPTTLWKIIVLIHINKILPIIKHIQQNSSCCKTKKNSNYWLMYYTYLQFNRMLDNFS